MRLIKRKFEKFVIVVVFTLLFSVTGISAATFTVTNTGDSGAGSLRQAILDADAAAGEDVIVFDAGVFNTPQTITLTSGELLIEDSNVTINGPGANLLSISGNDQSRSFRINAANFPVTVTINNLTIIDGNAGGGGGIRADSAGTDRRVILNISGVVFRDNTTNSGTPGGAIFIGLGIGELNINNSIFRRNTGNGGGAVQCGSGGGACVSVSITNTLFEENQSGGNGGAFACCGNGLPTTPITLEKVAFIRNATGVNGSAVRLSADVNTQFNFKNVTVAGNTAGGGAAMQFLFGKFNFENSTIAYNKNQTVNDDRGIGIFSVWQEMVVSFRNTIVAKNTDANGIARDIDVRNRILNSQGYNIFGTLVGGTVIEGDTTGNQVGVDPLLDAVPRVNGSFLKTLGLRIGSPAIDAGDPNNFLATDQRGIARPVDGDGSGSALPDIGAFEKRPSDIVPSSMNFDFDGDTRTDVSIFRPPVGEWWYLRSSDGGNNAVQFGTGSDKLVPADYTGDGKTDIAFWRPSSGEWFILRSEDLSFYAFPFGTAGDIPAPGDYDGDGRSDAAVFRPSIAAWFILNSSGGTTITGFGVPEDRPVVADYDGDGKSDIAVFRPSVSEWWISRSRDGLLAFQFGAAGDKAVPADFTGDGKADVAVFRPANGTWYVLRSEDNSFYAFPFGASGDTAVPGDYDGDGRADAAVYRPSNNVWYISGSTSGTQFVGFGTNGDLPVPGIYSEQ